MLYPSIVTATLFAVALITTHADAAPYVSNRATQKQLQQYEKDNSMQVMFIQSAKEAVVRRNAQNPEQLTLVLQNLNPEVAYVSERPTRTAGKTTVQNFITNFNNGQAQASTENPNATLIVNVSQSINSSQRNNDLLIVLSNPRYDMNSRSLTYDINPQRNGVAINEGIHQDPVLFIDNNCLWLCK